MTQLSAAIERFSPEQRAAIAMGIAATLDAMHTPPAAEGPHPDRPIYMDFREGYIYRTSDEAHKLGEINLNQMHWKLAAAFEESESCSMFTVWSCGASPAVKSPAGRFWTELKKYTDHVTRLGKPLHYEQTGAPGFYRLASRDGLKVSSCLASNIRDARKTAALVDTGADFETPDTVKRCGERIRQAFNKHPGSVPCACVVGQHVEDFADLRLAGQAWAVLSNALTAGHIEMARVRSYAATRAIPDETRAIGEYLSLQQDKLALLRNLADRIEAHTASSDVAHAATFDLARSLHDAAKLAVATGNYGTATQPCESSLENPTLQALLEQACSVLVFPEGYTSRERLDTVRFAAVQLMAQGSFTATFDTFNTERPLRQLIIKLRAKVRQCLRGDRRW